MLIHSKNIFQISVFFGVLVMSSHSQATITKCQDAEGKWHYGSNNAYLCADSSEITKLDKTTGARVGKVEAVKTAEQLEQESKQQERERKLQEQQEFELAERQRILMVYQTEEDIQRSKTNEINAIDQKIAQHENYIIALGKNKTASEKKKANTNNKHIIKQTDEKIAEIDEKIATSEKRIVELGERKVEVEKKYDGDLMTFRKYKDDK